MAERGDEKAEAGYVRDRSFYESRPSGGHTPKIHRASVTRTGMAACDTRFILLDTESPIPLRDDAAQKLRWCQRCYPPGSHVRYSPASCHPYDETCGGPGGPCRNHGGVSTPPASTGGA